MTLTPGTSLGPYEIVGTVGAGGMGEVYQARDTRLNRDVAIKVLPTSFAGDPDRRARFEREAQAVAALSHPNVIAIFDTGIHDGQLYVVMELLTGKTLRARLESGPMPVRKAVETAVQIARGLGAAHDKAIVHRDLKPENIFLLDDGQVKILDFGLARQVGEATSTGATQTMAMTGAGMVLGTVGYMAPEQVRGQAVDARADVFAFGTVLYEMVSGQRAFQRDTAADSMTAILTQDPPELIGSRPDLSPALDRIIRHCLEKNANERFQNARDIAFALETLSGSTIGASSGSASSGMVDAMSASSAPARPRMGMVMAAGIVGALVLAAGAGYLGRGAMAPTSAGIADVSYAPVSFEDGFVFAARFAPDNRTIVYSADWDDQPRGVYRTDLDSLEYGLIGFPGSDLLGISRTGELVVLADSTIFAGNPYFREGTLARGSLTGRASRAEMSGVVFADVGPDDDLAVVRVQAGRATMEYPVGQVLAEYPVSGNSIGSVGPRVSPSGEFVAFFSVRGAAVTVKIFSRSGQLVAESRTFSDWWALAWTPTNEVWFATTEGAGSRTSIFSLDPAGNQRLVWRAPGAITLHDISTDGDVLVSFDRGSSRTEFLPGPGTAPDDRSWREGGRLAALANDHTLLITGNGDSAGLAGAVYAWLPEEAQPFKVADGRGLAISPDGRKALVVSVQSPPKVSVVPTGPGQPQELELGAIDDVTWGGWLPDGRLVLQVERSGAETSVIMRSAAGDDAVALLPAGVKLDVASSNLISPQGTHIAAVDAAGQMVVCAIESSTCQPVPGSGRGDRVGGWSADGRALVSWTNQAGQVTVNRVDVTTGRRTPVTTIRPLETTISGIRTFIAAPDGAMAYTYSRAASQLYVIKGLK